MRNISCFIGGLLFSACMVHAQQQNEIRVTCSFENIPFKEFVKELEQRDHIQFFYLETWIDGMKVTLKADSISLTENDKRIIDERLEAYHKNPNLGSPWEEVYKRFIRPRPNGLPESAASCR